MKTKTTFLTMALLGSAVVITGCSSLNQKTTTTEQNEEPTVHFVVTDTEQNTFYDNEGNVIDAPAEGEALYGQDAQYEGIAPSYTDNGDGTVTDNNTGLMWQQTPHDGKLSYKEAVEYVENLNLGGYTDWRLPTMKESFSLASFNGHLDAQNMENSVPYIDTDYFDFTYDEQKAYTGSYWTSTVEDIWDDANLSSGDFNYAEKNYGFNWADGHLKSYADGYNVDGTESGFSIPAGVRAVRGEEGVYGVNDFQDNGDGTVSDNATNLMWTASTDSVARNWEDTLSWVQEMNDENYLGHNDWRLPNAKELHSIVQYGKSSVPALDTDYFSLTYDDCYLWTNTTCGDFNETAMTLCVGYGWSIPISSVNGGGVGPDNAEQSSMMTPPTDADGNVMAPPTDADGNIIPPPQGMNNGPQQQNPSAVSSSTETEAYTVDSFEDCHGTGCLRADYKSGVVPSLSAEKIAQIEPGKVIYQEDTAVSSDDEASLSNSENAEDLVIIYNYALLVRDK